MHKLLPRFLHHLDVTGIIPPGSRVLVAVSGGADSVALLHLLHRVAASCRLELRAAHLDHALRPDSPADAVHVHDLCAALDIPLTVTRIDVAALARAGRGGLEEIAREARRTFLRQTAQAEKCPRIALGHQRDDQAETFLLRLLRGAGPAGLAGMRPLDPPFVRPLLDFSRGELVAWLREEGIPWREDASNRDPAFTRNRVRHELLPLLATFNPAIGAGLAGLCRQLADDEADWHDRVTAELARTATLLAGETQLPCAALTEATPAMAGRLARAALESVRGDLRRIDAGHIRAVLALARGARPQGEVHLPGAWVGRRYAILRIRCRAPLVRSVAPCDIPGPGIYPLPDGRALAVTLMAAAAGGGATTAEFCAAAVPFPLQLRGPRPGDRLRPAGGTGSRKLQDLFVDARLPAEARSGAVLVSAADRLLWVAGVCRCAGLEPMPEGGPVLRLELMEGVGLLPQSP